MASTPLRSESKASSFVGLPVNQVDNRIIHDQVIVKGILFLKPFRIKDKCRLIGMEAILLLKHFLNVFNGV